MTVMFRTKLIRSTAAIALMAALGSGASAQEATHDTTSMESMAGAVHAMAPDMLEWGEGPPRLPAGAQMAVLSGNPTQEGPFALRLKFPAGYQIPLHTHSQDEHVTVISGAVFMTHGAAAGSAAVGETAGAADDEALAAEESTSEDTMATGEEDVATAGTGESPEATAPTAGAEEITAGGYMLLPAGHRHSPRVEEETVVQIHGMGPFDIVYVNPEDDPQKKVN